jgi:hypothetical protein
MALFSRQENHSHQRLGKTSLGIIIGKVDVNARFIFSELKWYGSTNDNVAIKFCGFSQRLEDGELPEDLHVIGDEAFCASHKQFITPYSKKILRQFPFESAQYRQHRTAWKRCTVERSFGMLLRKFIILSGSVLRYEKEYCSSHLSSLL